MHYKDGTPAAIGDIVLNDNGSVGIIIGGQYGSDFCSTQVVSFKSVNGAISGYPSASPTFTGRMTDAAGKFCRSATVRVDLDQNVQTREMVKIGHVELDPALAPDPATQGGEVQHN